MNELTLEEYNFLRWLLSQDKFDSNIFVKIDVKLTDYQTELLSSIKFKLKLLSSY
jgi:hypothetical protein